LAPGITDYVTGWAFDLALNGWRALPFSC